MDRKTAAPLIPEFQDYVLDSLIARGDLRQMKVLSFTERMEAWSLTLLPEDRNVTDILEQGLKDGRITIPGAVPDAADGFAEVNGVTSYLNTFGVTVADRIRSQFVPKFDPASEPLSEEILEVNDYIHEKPGIPSMTPSLQWQRLSSDSSVNTKWHSLWRNAAAARPN